MDRPVIIPAIRKGKKTVGTSKGKGLGLAKEFRQWIVHVKAFPHSNMLHHRSYLKEIVFKTNLYLYALEGQK
jgi:hypothetical protein